MFTVAQLDDLQSKLMLVAGQAHLGKEHIARFVEVSITVVYLHINYCLQVKGAEEL